MPSDPATPDRPRIFGVIHRRLRCWVCLDAGYVRSTTGRWTISAPCTNPHCAAGAGARSKRSA